MDNKEKVRYSVKEKLEILDEIKPIIDALDNRLHKTGKLQDAVMAMDAVKVSEFLDSCEAAHNKYFERMVISPRKSGKELLGIKQELLEVCKNVYA